MIRVSEIQLFFEDKVTFFGTGPVRAISISGFSVSEPETFFLQLKCREICLTLMSTWVQLVMAMSHSQPRAINQSLSKLKFDSKTGKWNWLRKNETELPMETSRFSKVIPKSHKCIVEMPI